MILAALLAAGAVRVAERPDDIDRFISVCVEGSRAFVDRSSKVLDGPDVPELYSRLFGRPGKGPSSLRHFVVGEAGTIVAVQENGGASAHVPSACTIAAAGFTKESARQALLKRLRDRKAVDVTEERLIPSNLRYERHERAYSNAIVIEKIGKREEIDRFTLQTADPTLEIFGREMRSGNLYWLSALRLNEVEARSAGSAWSRCQKIDCSLPR